MLYWLQSTWPVLTDGLISPPAFLAGAHWYVDWASRTSSDMSRGSGSRSGSKLPFLTFKSRHSLMLAFLSRHSYLFDSCPPLALWALSALHLALPSFCLRPSLGSKSSLVTDEMAPGNWGLDPLLFSTPLRSIDIRHPHEPILATASFYIFACRRHLCGAYAR